MCNRGELGFAVVRWRKNNAFVMTTLSLSQTGVGKKEQPPKKSGEKERTTLLSQDHKCGSKQFRKEPFSQRAGCEKTV